MDKHLIRSITGHSGSSSSSVLSAPGIYADSRDSYKPPSISNNVNDFLDFAPKFHDDSLGKPLQYQSKSNCQDQWLDFLKPERDFVKCENEHLQEELYSDKDLNENMPIFKEVPSPFKSQGHNIFDEPENGMDLGGEGLSSDFLAPKLSALPVANFEDFYNDLVADSNKEMDMKRNGNAIGTPLGTPPARGCDCKIKVSLKGV